jgi:hypothetical protein
VAVAAAGAGEEERAFGRSSEARTDDVGVSEGDCETWGDCMRAELAGDWGRGEDIVAMVGCTVRECHSLWGASGLECELGGPVFSSKADFLIWLDGLGTKLEKLFVHLTGLTISPSTTTYEMSR